MTRCRACAHGDCESCQTLGMRCDCCRYADMAPEPAPHEDPCDCDDCRDAVEAQQELEYESLKAEGLA